MSFYKDFIFNNFKMMKIEIIEKAKYNRKNNNILVVLVFFIMKNQIMAIINSIRNLRHIDTKE